MERLKQSIVKGTFAWQRYLNGGIWRGLSIQTEPIFCSYGQCGFNVWSPYGESFNGTISHDFGLEKTYYFG